MRRGRALFTLLAVLAMPSAAAAQAPVAPPLPAPVAVQTTMTLALGRIGGTRATTLVRSPILVAGTIAAYVPNEQVTIRATNNGHKILAKTVAIQAGPDGTGVFTLHYRPTRSGRLVLRAVHVPTPALGALAAVGRAVDVLPRRVGAASPRSAVRALQRRLHRLGYVVGARGRFDARTQRAVLAFRKVTGMARTSVASTTVMHALARGRGTFKIRHPEHGRHIEADLSRQVLALIDNGRVARIYPISSGKPSTPTVIGSFHVYSKTPGTNAKGMVYSSYFLRGYATHGYFDVPPFPASHGCLRVPIPDAIPLFDWIRIGTPVDVYP